MKSMNIDFENRFYGSEEFYPHFMGLTYTEGVKAVAEECGAYWLIDLIASYQPQLKRRLAPEEKELPDFQLWELFVESKTAKVVCSEDVDQEILSQDIDYTDFPYDYAKLYVVGGVLMLPSEY